MMKNTCPLALALMLVFLLSVPAGAQETWARVTPGFLNTVKCKSIMGTIYIDSAAEGVYDISITGVPQEWLDYPEKVYADKGKKVNYVVSPAEPGIYWLRFYVEGEGFDHEEEVRLWVSAGGAEEAYSGEGDDGLEGGATGMFVLSEDNQALFIYALVAMGAVVAVFLGHRMLREEEGWENV